ncbi:MAG: hypothetical protein ACRELY_05160, partial [Polyangiaceae bacterium]
NDVVRSVLLGAAMISPAALIACAQNPPPADATTVDVPPPMETSAPDPTPVASTTATPVATSDPYGNTPAPDSSVVRPRTPNGTNQMPMRGFSGAARRARA